MIIFTSICANYLHKARTLAKSVKEHISDATFIVSLLETQKKPAYNSPYFDDIVLVKDYWGDGFERFIFKHTIVEASTAVKGRAFQYLYERFPNENEFVYLDPDVYVYSDFVELRRFLQTRPIILCPHLLQPGNIDMELSSTAHGVYNLGFLAVNRMDEARRFIDWWAERLSLFCYDDMRRGIFTDQKWVDLAPCFFDVEILKHKGYDFATWSLLNCGMWEENKSVFVRNDALRFIHFSGYGSCIETCIRDWLPQGDHPFKRLYAAYVKIHDANDTDGISKTPWSYACYTSGEKIQDHIRKAYRANSDMIYACENPFQKSNQFYAKLLARYDGQKYKNYFCRAIDIYTNEGACSLLRKAAKKIIR